MTTSPQTELTATQLTHSQKLMAVHAKLYSLVFPERVVPIVTFDGHLFTVTEPHRKAHLDAFLFEAEVVGELRRELLVHHDRKRALAAHYAAGTSAAVDEVLYGLRDDPEYTFVKHAFPVGADERRAVVAEVVGRVARNWSIPAAELSASLSAIIGRELEASPSPDEELTAPRPR